MGGILWLHMIVMLIACMVLYPAVLICRSHQRVRFQAIAEFITILTISLGTVLGFIEQVNNNFHSTTHGELGYFITILYMIVTLCDVKYLQSPPTSQANARSTQEILRGITIITLLVLFYVVSLLGVLTLFGLCGYPYTQQCFGHLGIGSSFLLYFSFRIFLAFSEGNVLFTGFWARSEVMDTLLILPGGLGLALFGHAWGYPWDNESIQHVSLGILSIIGALLSIWLSNPSSGQRKCNIFPGLISIIAGYTFLSHPAKPNTILAYLHQGMGFLITCIGITRILDVASLYHLPLQQSRGFQSPWNALATFLGVAAGLFIMAANEEQAAIFLEYNMNGPVVGMGLLACAMGVMGYVSVIAVLSRGFSAQGTVEYASVEMEEYERGSDV